MLTKIIAIMLLTCAYVTASYAVCYTGTFNLSKPERLTAAAPNSNTTVTIEGIKNAHKFEPLKIEIKNFTGSTQLPVLKFCNEYDEQQGEDTAAMITLVVKMKKGDTETTVMQGSCKIGFRETCSNCHRHPYLTSSSVYGVKITAKGKGALTACQITDVNHSNKSFKITF
jgi:hypothetical protein